MGPAWEKFPEKISLKTTVMDMVLEEAPDSRNVLEEIEKDDVYCFEEIADIYRESDPTAGLDLDDELAH